MIKIVADKGIASASPTEIIWNDELRAEGCDELFIDGVEYLLHYFSLIVILEDEHFSLLNLITLKTKHLFPI